MIKLFFTKETEQKLKTNIYTHVCSIFKQVGFSDYNFSVKLKKYSNYSCVTASVKSNALKWFFFIEDENQQITQKIITKHHAKKKRSKYRQNVLLSTDHLQNYRFVNSYVKTDSNNILSAFLDFICTLNRYSFPCVDFMDVIYETNNKSFRYINKTFDFLNIEKSHQDFKENFPEYKNPFIFIVKTNNQENMYVETIQIFESEQEYFPPEIAIYYPSNENAVSQFIEIK